MEDWLSRGVLMRIRQAFDGLKLHRIVPAGLAKRAEQFAYLRRMSEWQSRHAHIEHGYSVTENGTRLRLPQVERLLREENLTGAITYLEFGVAAGQSFKWWVEKNTDPGSRFVGFDTFTGLPEAWGSMPEGTFDAGGTPPRMEDERCHFEKGLFADTLPDFLKENDLEERLVVHLDADLYGPTLFVLTMLWPKLKKDDVLILGDFCSLRHPTHVFRAFRDFTDAYPFSYEGVDSTSFGHQFVIRVT
jgi:hypothetical protein